MSKNPVSHQENLYEYLKTISLRESDELRELRELTLTMKFAVMQISPDQGQFMAMLVKLIRATLIVEIGTFTGYSALTMAQAMPADGKLIACDISEEWTAIGKTYWKRAGVDHKIDLRLAPALTTLDELLLSGLGNTVDLVFIDADKGNYPAYFDRAYKLVKPNGLIVVDNVFWGGAIVDQNDQDPDTLAIRKLNQIISADTRVDISMISIGDGLFLARKK